MLDEVHLLNAGYCTHPRAMTHRGAGWSPGRYPAGFALIRHSQHGPILFDTGYSDHFFTQTRHWPGSLYARVTPVHLQADEPACRQVEALGIKPDEVRHIIVSHFHADHIAGLRDFPSAYIWCTWAAWESVRPLRGLKAVSRGFLPGLIPHDIDERLIFMDDQLAVPLPSALAALGPGRDIFADGQIIAVDLPGHAIGQIGLLLPSAPAGPLFLVADAAWSQEAIASGTPSPRFTSAVLGNTYDYRTTLARLHKLHQAMPTLRLVPSHDMPAEGAGLPVADFQFPIVRDDPAAPSAKSQISNPKSSIPP